ncbi:MAG: hypothetical protein IPP71_15635 [Bacteroidetes bacterium]|nr:hypothetical protein [Bacteroidota bacterium]
MNKLTQHLFLIAFLVIAGSSLSFAQNSSKIEELLVQAPGFSASKQMESIKNQSNGSNGLTFVAWFEKSDLFQFRIDRQLQPDNNLIHSIFADVNITIIQDQEQTRTLINEMTQPKNDISAPVIKNQ